MPAVSNKPFPFVVNPSLLPDSEEALRAYIARALPPRAHAPIRQVTIIGAQRVDFNSARTDIDAARLALLLRYLADSGAPVDPGFTVDAVDFRDDRNFLTETGKTDLVFASYIRGRPSKSSPAYGPGFDKAGSFHAQCPLTEQDGWRRRVHASGAKIFAAFGGLVEVGTQHVVRRDGHDKFIELVANPRDIDADIRERHQTLAYIYPRWRDIDLPCTWLGIAMDRDYAAALARKDNFLGRRIADGLSLPPARGKRKWFSFPRFAAGA